MESCTSNVYDTEVIANESGYNEYLADSTCLKAPDWSDRMMKLGLVWGSRGYPGAYQVELIPNST